LADYRFAPRAPAGAGRIGGAGSPRNAGFPAPCRRSPRLPAAALAARGTAAGRSGPGVARRHVGERHHRNLAGVAGQPWTILSATNLALPLSQWQPVANGTFSVPPIQSYTNSALNEAKRFYRVSSP